MSSKHEDIVREMLARVALSGAELGERVRNACRPDYWRGLFSQFGIEGPGRIGEATLDAVAIDDAIRQKQRDDYFRLPVILTSASLHSLNGCVDRIVNTGWPAAFAFVYDEFWSLAHIAGIRQVVGSALGDRYRQIPHVWIHVVPALEGAAGWTPHVDGDGPDRISVWIALTDATADNGCMHLLPKRAARDFSVESPANSPVDREEVFRLLQNVRALPVPAGAALGWTFDTLHWGGPSRQGSNPRRAVSLEFIAESAMPTTEELPIIDLSRPIPFAARVRAIAHGIKTYAKFEAALVRYTGVATGILERVADVGQPA